MLVGRADTMSSVVRVMSNEQLTVPIGYDDVISEEVSRNRGNNNQSKRNPACEPWGLGVRREELKIREGK